MYPQLSNLSYIKIKPDGTLASFVISGDRTNVTINETAFEILNLCNGYYSIDEIELIICNNHNISKEIVHSNVQEFLMPLLKLGAVVNRRNAANTSIVKGSNEFYYPDYIIWELTTQCPLRCLHCYLPNKEHIFVNKKNIDRILKIIHTTGVYSVQLTGGEAMLHPEIGYIIDSLINANIQVSLSSSGFILNSFTQNIIKKLELHGIIRISIDGNEEYHNNIRQNSSAYKKSINFLKYAIKHNILCQVSTVLIDQPIDMIDVHVRKMRDIGVSILVLSPISVQGEAKKNQLHMHYDWNSVSRIISVLNKKYASNSFMIQEPSDKIVANCGCGYNVIRIRPDLSITPCPMIEITLGTLETSEYNNILKEKSIMYSKLFSPGPTMCEKCKNQKYCSKCIACALQNKENSKNCIWEITQKDIIKCL